MRVIFFLILRESVFMRMRARVYVSSDDSAEEKHSTRNPRKDRVIELHTSALRRVLLKGTTRGMDVNQRSYLSIALGVAQIDCKSNKRLLNSVLWKVGDHVDYHGNAVRVCEHGLALVVH